MSTIIGNPRFAVLGPKGSFSHIAAMKYAAAAGHKDPQFKFYEHFNDLHDALDKAEADYSVHPVFNMLGGSVEANQNIFRKLVEDSLSDDPDKEKQSKDFSIVGTVNLEIKLALMVKPGTTREQIGSTLCYKHGNLQFKNYAKNMGWHQGEASSTAAAAKAVAEGDDHTIAAVASKEAAEIYGLEILEENIADIVEGQPENHTTFVITSAKKKHRKNARQGIIFEVNDKEGDLQTALLPFKEENVNMPYIESFHNPELDKDYIYCEVDADTTQNQLDRTCYKIIGQGRSMQMLDKMEENRHLKNAIDDKRFYKYNLQVTMQNVSGYLLKVLKGIKVNIPHIHSIPDSKRVITSMHFKFKENTSFEDLNEACDTLSAQGCAVSLWENKTKHQPN